MRITTKQIIYWIVLVLWCLILFWALGEIIIRLILPPPLALSSNNYVQHNGYYTYPVNQTFNLKNEPGADISISTDKFGFRNSSVEPSTVLLTGDSYIMANNTLWESTIAGILNQKGIKTYNAGMDGFSTFDSLHSLTDLLPVIKPKVLVVGFYLGNDWRDNYLAISGGSTKAHPKWTKTILQRSRLVQFLYGRGYLGWVKGYSKSKMNSYSLSELDSYVTPLSPEMVEAQRKTQLALQQLKNILAPYKTKLVILGIPSKAQVYRSFHEISQYNIDRRTESYAKQILLNQDYSFDQPNNLLTEITKKENIKYFSLMPLFRQHMNDNIFYQLDVHWSDKGQAIAADALLNLVRSLI